MLKIKVENMSYCIGKILYAVKIFKVYASNLGLALPVTEISL